MAVYLLLCSRLSTTGDHVEAIQGAEYPNDEIAKTSLENKANDEGIYIQAYKFVGAFCDINDELHDTVMRIHDKDKYK